MNAPLADEPAEQPAEGLDRSRQGKPRLGRVCTKSEFDHIFREGARASTPRMRVVVARVPQEPFIRVGFAVSRKHGGAVKRNRIRRRLREAFRQLLPELPRGLAVMCIPSVQEELPYEVLVGDVRELVLRAQRKLEARA
ncbi:MAG: ribonuclease P protein component [Planctomycetota bacterium]